MKREIVSVQDFAKIHQIFRYPGGRQLAGFIIWLLRINKLNGVYARNAHLNPSDFIDGIAEDLGLAYSISEEDLKKIPSSGSFILISNHPFGGAEAIITLRFMKEIRPDFKFMANFLLNQIEPMKPYFISVNPFENMKSLRSSYSGLKMASAHVQEGYGLGIFPAGEVSTYQKEVKMIADKKWPPSIMKFIKAQETIVIPMFVGGHNSKFFHFLGKIHPMLRTIKLPSELINKRKYKINITIGEPISPEKQREFKEMNSFTQFLRSKVYHLNKD